MLGLQKERDASAAYTFAELEDCVQKAEHVDRSYLWSAVYRDIAELDGYGVKPEVEALLKRAEAVRELEGEFFPDMEGTLAALEKGQSPLTWECVSQLALQAVCHHSVCANRVKNCPDNTEFQQALVKALDWRVRAERLLGVEIAKNRAKDRAQLAKMEQEVLDAERVGNVLAHDTYLTLATNAESGRPEAVALLKRAETVRERDGLFFRNLEGTINALERGKLELTNEQLFALYLQASCNLSAIDLSQEGPDKWYPRKSRAESLNARATRLFTEGMARERARENERDHEGDLSSPHS